MSDHDIGGSYDVLVEQASKSAADYLLRAVIDIDRIYSEGYAERHPALVIAMIQVASADMNHAMLKLAAQDIRDGLRDVGRV